MNSPDVVIVVDLQTGMFNGVLEPPLYEALLLQERVRSILAWARRTGRPVCFIRHDGPAGDPLAPGEPGWHVWPGLGQLEGEPTFGKSVGDAFSAPELVAWVRECGAEHAIMVGAQTDYCVAATVRGAQQQGLAVTVVADAHSTWDTPSESAAAIIARHNQLFSDAGAQVEMTSDIVTR